MFSMFKKKEAKVKAVTDIEVLPEPTKIDKKAPKLPTVTIKYDPLAIELANNLLTMVEEFEANIRAIEKHPGLSKEAKLDIQHYMNKNIITTLWALAPAFDLIASYPRAKIFRALFNQAIAKGSPGILVGRKRV